MIRTLILAVAVVVLMGTYLTVSSSPVSGCHCQEDHATADYGCSDVVAAQGIITPIQDGECQAETGCINKQCRWTVYMALTTNGTHVFSVYVDAGERATITGHKVELNDIPMSADCNSGTSLAIGFGGNICIECVMECGPCGS